MEVGYLDYAGYGHASFEPILQATEEVYKHRNDKLKDEYSKFVKDQQNKEIKTIDKLRKKIDKYSHKSRLLESKIKDEINQQQENTNIIINHQSMATENALLRSSLK